MCAPISYVVFVSLFQRDGCHLQKPVGNLSVEPVEVPSVTRMPSNGWKVVTTIVVVGILAIVVIFIDPLSEIVGALNSDSISEWVNAAGLWGPILIIGRMAACDCCYANSKRSDRTCCWCGVRPHTWYDIHRHRGRAWRADRLRASKVFGP